VSSAEDDLDMQARVARFWQGLERLGWSEDRNARIDARFAAGKADQFQMLAKELTGAHARLALPFYP
jgi:putative ABC transport system substrate-binding protein